ncbi:MAG: DUF4954 family protein [Bacteroidales bacterium]
MPKVTVIQPASLGKGFVPAEYLAEGSGQYDIRNMQSKWPVDKWRHLRSDEIESLVKNQNTADNWDEILVTDCFDSSLVRNNKFFGLVRIGCVRDIVLRHHDLKLSVGITNSLVINCDVGDDVAIHNVQYLSNYIVGDRCILFNLMEVNTTNHAKFGNGIVKDGENEDVRVWLDLMNETGARQVIPFDGMLPGDAWIWAKYRDDIRLQDKLKEITQNKFDTRRGYYGTIGDECVIKNSHTLKDIRIGSGCYVKGANKLKNLTIHSSEDEPTQIGEGVELVNGIIGYGCRIFYGCKAVKFILGNNSNLKYGARLINSYLGDNSTISCCEVLNNLIFPAHEQHHNNSFLVASVIMGQSNIAAGATIGSNHNSRANDSEIVAGRGFWPGLCTSLKHSSRFASYTLISKADYLYELDIKLPFSLVNNNIAKDRLEVMPAFWWMHNMYALARNSRKFIARDNRLRKLQNIEFEALAPDTAEEILSAMRLLEVWTAKAELRGRNTQNIILSDDQLANSGSKILSGPEEYFATLEVLGEAMENSSRNVLILKPQKAYRAYREMLHHYALRNLTEYIKSNPSSTLSSMSDILGAERETSWVNVGGQLMPEKDIDIIRTDIKSGRLETWDKIHKRYDELWDKYNFEKEKHAYAILCILYNSDRLTSEIWNKALEKAGIIQQYVCDQVYLSRKKDYNNPFRIMVYRNEEEMKAIMGDIEQNDFIKLLRGETDAYKSFLNDMRSLPVE